MSLWCFLGEVFLEKLENILIVFEVVLVGVDFMLLKFVQSCIFEFDVRMCGYLIDYDDLIFVIFLENLFLLGLMRSYC